MTVFALIGISLPSFFFATILKWIFSINLKWVDLYGIVSRMHESYGSVGKVLDMAQHLILPVITLTIVSVGSLMRYTRTNMLEVSKCRLHPYCQSEGCTGEEGGLSPCIPKYSDSDHHHPWKYTSKPVWRSHDHRDFVPDPGNRIHILSGTDPG